MLSYSVINYILLVYDRHTKWNINDAAIVIVINEGHRGRSRIGHMAPLQLKLYRATSSAFALGWIDPAKLFGSTPGI